MGFDDSTQAVRCPGASQGNPSRISSAAPSTAPGWTPIAPISTWPLPTLAAQITDYYIVMRNSAGLTPWSGTVHDVTGTAQDTGIEAVTLRLQ